MTDVVLGMGEVGSTLFDLLTMRGYDCIGVDTDAIRSRNQTSTSVTTELIHICIPGDITMFQSVVRECANTYKDAQAILVHSTVRPGTAASLQEKTNIPIISSPVRGVHRRFLEDMQRYTKFVATDVNIDQNLISKIEDRFKKVHWLSSTKTAEFAKILTDTTYYGWLINYAQLTKIICDMEEMDYDEMWSFADEPHQFLGNRPKMYPGIIGGHCVIPNLALIDYPELKTVGDINDIFRKHLSQNSNLL